MDFKDLTGIIISFIALVISIISLAASRRAERGRLKIEFEQKRQEALLDLSKLIFAAEARQRKLLQFLVDVKINPTVESPKLVDKAGGFQSHIHEEIEQVQTIRNKLTELSGNITNEDRILLETFIGQMRQWKRASKDWDDKVDTFIAAGQQLNEIARLRNR